MKSVLFLLLATLFTPVLYGQLPAYQLKPAGPHISKMTLEKNTLTVDLGEVQEKTKIEDLAFWLINPTDSALVIERLKWAGDNCGPTWTQDPVQPGDSTLISFFCGVFVPGSFSRTTYLQTNMGSTRLFFRGKGIPDPYRQE